MRFIDPFRLTAVFLYVFTYLAAFLFRLLGVKQKDGWRQSAQVFHRQDRAKYVVNQHNLKLVEPVDNESQEQALGRVVQEVIKKFPWVHYALEPGLFANRRITNPIQDVVLAKFNDDGSLNKAQLMTDQITNPEELAQLEELLIEQYNQYRNLPGPSRPRRLLKGVTKAIQQTFTKEQQEICRQYAFRWLRASWLMVVECKDRFAPDPMLKWKHPGMGILFFKLETSSEGWMDLHMQVSHIGMDGIPAIYFVQELIKKVGLFSEDFVFPPLSHPHMSRCAVETERPRIVFERQAFAMQDLLDCRRKLNEELSEHLDDKIPLAAFWIWLLSAHELFKGHKFNTPIGIDLKDPQKSTLGYVFIRPESYRKKYKDQKQAFTCFSNDMRKQMKIVQNRQGRDYRFLSLCGYIPAMSLWPVPVILRKGLYSLSGSICVAILQTVEMGWELLPGNIDALIGVASAHLKMGDQEKCAIIGGTAREPLAGKLSAAFEEITKNPKNYLGF
jgi:hypothetical protein